MESSLRRKAVSFYHLNSPVFREAGGAGGAQLLPVRGSLIDRDYILFNVQADQCSNIRLRGKELITVGHSQGKLVYWFL